jgi:hypothetical protein
LTQNLPPWPRGTAYRVVQGLPASGRARPGRDVRPTRRRYDGPRLARAARLFAMREPASRNGRERDEEALTANAGMREWGWFIRPPAGLMNSRLGQHWSGSSRTGRQARSTGRPRLHPPAASRRTRGAWAAGNAGPVQR